MKTMMHKSLHPLCALMLLLLVSAATAQSDAKYNVIINKEGQHAIWIADGDPPMGWQATKTMGTTQDCSEYISKVWTDMRPLSLQKKYKKKMKDGYVVIINHEEQYMIWPRDEYVPDDWSLAGAGGDYSDCEAFIEEVWTDMRPLSLRKRMKE